MAGSFEVLDELIELVADEEREEEKTELHCIPERPQISLGKFMR